MSTRQLTTCRSRDIDLARASLPNVGGMNAGPIADVLRHPDVHGFWENNDRSVVDTAICPIFDEVNF